MRAAILTLLCASLAAQPQYGNVSVPPGATITAVSATEVVIVSFDGCLATFWNMGYPRVNLIPKSILYLDSRPCAVGSRFGFRYDFEQNPFLPYNFTLNPTTVYNPFAASYSCQSLVSTTLFLDYQSFYPQTQCPRPYNAQMVAVLFEVR